jgi:hypothetical protein
MWVVLVRAPRPDAPCWRGRRWLAALDALAWPGLGLGLLSQVTARPGLALSCAHVLVVVWGLRRMHRALLCNHRYHFTAWRVCRWLVGLVAVGGLLEATMR